MFRTRALVLGFAVLLLGGSTASAASNVWARGYPKSLGSGKIAIKGTATADAGFTLGKTGVASAWLAGRQGGVVTSISITVDPKTGAWSGTFTGLAADKHYVIVVQVTQTKGTTTDTIATQPRTQETEDDRDRR